MRMSRMTGSYMSGLHTKRNAVVFSDVLTPRQPLPPIQGSGRTQAEEHRSLKDNGRQVLGASQRKYKLDCAKLWVKGGVAERQRSVSIHGTQFLQSNPMISSSG